MYPTPTPYLDSYWPGTETQSFDTTSFTCYLLYQNMCLFIHASMLTVRSKRRHLSPDNLFIDFSFTTLSSYLAYPLLIVAFVLGYNWFMAEFLHPSTPCGMYLVHAKFKLIYIWAKQHALNSSALVISVSSSISRSIQKEEGRQSYTVGKGRSAGQRETCSSPKQFP